MGDMFDEDNRGLLIVIGVAIAAIASACIVSALYTYEDSHVFRWLLVLAIPIGLFVLHRKGMPNGLAGEQIARPSAS